jgi:hypothetical protein
MMRTEGGAVFGFGDVEPYSPLLGNGMMGKRAAELFSIPLFNGDRISVSYF